MIKMILAFLILFAAFLLGSGFSKKSQLVKDEH